MGQDSGNICFEFSAKKFPTPEDVKTFLMSYPVLNFHVKRQEGEEPMVLKWYPSEYFYRERLNSYCMAIEKQTNSNQIILGGTFMRQNAYVFDLDQNKVGIARAMCNEETEQIKDEKELIASGQRYGLDPSHTLSLNQVCKPGEEKRVSEIDETTIGTPPTLSQLTAERVNKSVPISSTTLKAKQHQLAQNKSAESFVNNSIGGAPQEKRPQIINDIIFGLLTTLILLILWLVYYLYRENRRKPLRRPAQQVRPAADVLPQEIELQSEPFQSSKLQKDKLSGWGVHPEEEQKKTQYYMDFENINDMSIDETIGQVSDEDEEEIDR